VGEEWRGMGERREKRVLEKERDRAYWNFIIVS
jgi:hypothetical protein